MSASEKLKALGEESFAAPWFYDVGSETRDLRDTLPQIVAVVEAAEKEYAICVSEQLDAEALGAALTALESALS